MPEIGSQSTDSQPVSMLRPYQFHGLDVSEPSLGEEAMTDCIFCGKEGKFSVNITTGKWRCWSCEMRGNVATFLHRLWERSFEQEVDYSDLQADRKLLSEECLKEWRVAYSLTTREWVIPGYNHKGAFAQLYRYVYESKSGKHRLYSTPKPTAQHLMGMHLYDANKPFVYVLEGPWDGMAFWEVMGAAKQDPDDPSGLAFTDEPSESLLSQANVLAVPGCNAFHDAWLPVFAGKHVIFLYDNDYPREYNGRIIEPAGYSFTRRACNILAAADNPPESIQFLSWGDGGYDSSLPNGYDVRDHLSQGDTIEERIDRLRDLFHMFRPIPSDWVGGRTAAARKAGKLEIELLPCRTWADATDQLRRAMHITAGLEYALAVMLATATSTKMIDDQLWIKIISPPSTGKTALVECLAANRKHTKTVGNFTGLHSGYQTDRTGEEDHSLLSLLRDKTLIIKEGDTILKAPNRDKIFSQIRDIYDTHCSVAFGNKVKREYNIRFSFILCGTPSLFEMDSSELGDRYLTANIMDGIDPELEMDINQRTFYRMLRNRGLESDGVASSYVEPEMLKARQMIGGYLNYLRDNSAQLLDELDESNAHLVEKKINRLAKFVAHMRARPSKTQDEVVSREMSARIDCQLTKLALCLSLVLNRPAMDNAVMRYVVRVAIDSSRGRTLNVIKALHNEGRERGASTEALAGYLSRPVAKVTDDINFLKALEAIEAFKPQYETRYRLTEMMEDLYMNVMSPNVLPQE